MQVRPFVLAISLLIFTSVSLEARAIDCEAALKFLDETYTVPSDAQGNQLAKQSPFKDWLFAQGLDWASLEPARKKSILGSFYATQLAPYLKQDIGERRSQALWSELRHRGAPMVHGRDGNGYELLKLLSQSNRQRMWLEFNLRFPALNIEQLGPDYPRADIENKLALLDLVFIHNTTSLVNRPTAPLLSSQELTKMGITTKLNTNVFYRVTLKTDGNLFFFAIPYLRSGPFPQVSSQYGDVSLILSRGFAAQYGWVSPFVMYEEDLLDLAGHAFPNADRATWIVRLHQYDLTTDDMIGLMRDSIRHSLQRLWMVDRAEFSRVKAQLMGGYELRPVIAEYSLGAMGYPFDNLSRALELKIPISVPSEALDIRLSPEPSAFSRSFFGLPPQELDSPY